jgi:hypothetical protein
VGSSIAGKIAEYRGFGAKSEERVLRGIGVITRDAALRDVLRSVPAGAPADEVYAALAGYYEITATGDRKGKAAPVREKDLRGDLHTHTDLTDGVASLRAMIEAAQGRGHEYYAVTDHAPNLVMQRMTTQKMLDQRAEVRALADSTDMTLLHGSELNIAPDGTVDWDADFLAGFDICVASVRTENPIPKHWAAHGLVNTARRTVWARRIRAPRRFASRFCLRA